MKKTVSLLALIVCLCAMLIPVYAVSEAAEQVEISFDFNRMSTMASNQFAVWIEDEDGQLIRTLYVTDFTARRRGYEKRDMSLPGWVAAAEPSKMTDAELDAVSGATPVSGSQRFTWDRTDAAGMTVPTGTYVVKVEGTLYWESDILYTADINLDAENGMSPVVIETRTDPENQQNEDMLSNVEVNVKKIEDNTANWLGGLSPEDALAYMKEHYDEGLVIVEVNTDYWKLSTGFTGAMHIPHDQMSERYNEIPSGVPVILHCGAGVVSVPAYETLMEKRPDIPQLSYIAGRPPVNEFNAWLKEHGK